MTEASSEPVLALACVTRPSQSTFRVLVVEDDDAVRDVFMIGLTNRGHAVEAVATGAEARNRVLVSLERSYPYDALVLDLSLSDADGRELATELATIDPALHRRTVLVSGFLTHDRPEGRPPELRKPFSLESLSRTIDRLARPDQPIGKPASPRGPRRPRPHRPRPESPGPD